MASRLIALRDVWVDAAHLASRRRASDRTRWCFVEECRIGSFSDLLPLLVLRNTNSCARRVRRLLSMSSRITLLAKLAISGMNTGTSIYGSNLLPVPYREYNRRQYPSRERTPMALTANCGDPFLMRQKRRNFGPVKILSPLVASTLRQERKAYFAGRWVRRSRGCTHRILQHS